MSRAQVTSLICNNFGGIRRKDASFSDEKITCSDCQNVELFYTEQNNGVGIRTTKGNVLFHNFNNEDIVGLFESNQGGKKVVFVYTEDTSNGYLYQCDFMNSIFTKLDFTLQKTGMACATDFVSGYSDYFVFSNGEKVVFLYTDNTKPIKTIETPAMNIAPFNTRFDVDGNLISNHGTTATGLGLAVFDNKLWIFNDNVLYFSYKGVPTDFVTQDADKPEASAGFIELTKPITAIHEYLGKLAVFHKDSSCLVSPNASTIYSIEDESPGGCASYNSLVFHGTDLYFYDDTKKGVYGFAQIVNGDKTLTSNIAEDLQEEFMLIPSTNLNKIRTMSVVTEDRNEVWFILPISYGSNRTLILIFDYIRGEWLKRYSNKINCLFVYESDLYSGGNKLYKEYQSDTFDGEFIESFYKCSIFNYGTDNTLKITKYPPRLTVDICDGCDFVIEYVRNYDTTKKSKTKEIKSKFANKVLVYDNDMKYDEGHQYKHSANAIVKLPSTTFKALEMNFKTEIDKPYFAIKNIEFSKLKVKQV